MLLAALLLFSVAACTKPVDEQPTSSPEASISPETSVTPTPSPSTPPSPSASTVPDDSQPGRDEESTLRFMLGGKEVSERASLVSADFGTGIRGYGYNLYCLSSDFSYALEDGADKYSCRSVDNCYLELCYISDSTVEKALPAFLDSYLNYTDIEYTGDYNLADMLYTQGATATDGTITYEAYLADADGGILAFILCYPNKEADNQALRLHAMLDSFEFNY